MGPLRVGTNEEQTRAQIGHRRGIPLRTRQRTLGRAIVHEGDMEPSIIEPVRQTDRKKQSLMMAN